MNYLKVWLKKENIYIYQKAESELEAIYTMLSLADKNPAVTNSKQLAQDIFDHEILHGSHRGCCGVTFHAISSAVTHPLILVSRFENGIGYYSKEKKPIDFVVLMAAPSRYEQSFKQMVCNVKDLLCDSKLMESIRDIKSQDKIYKLLFKHCFKVKQNSNRRFLEI